MSFLSSLFGSNTQSDRVKLLSVDEFNQAIAASKVQLVDVRTRQEYKQGYIAHAINNDFFGGSAFLTQFEKWDKSQPIYLYCRSGNRSNKAAHQLAQMGFETIYDLQGGYMKWIKTQ